MGRLHWVDVLRGLSILAVLLTHLSQKLAIQSSTLPFLPDLLFKALFRRGYYGVVVFFVISGFLITSTSLRRWGRLGHVDLFRFFRFRVARIAPNLLLVLALLGALHVLDVPGFILTEGATTLGRALVSALTFHVNWHQVFIGGLPLPWNVLWSLSIEEVFYLGFPLLCLLLRFEPLIVLGLSVFVVLGPMARVDASQPQAWRDLGYLSGMDGIALGCLAGLASQRLHLKGWPLMGLCILSGLGMVGGFAFNSYLYKALGAGGLVSFLAGSTALVLFCVHRYAVRGFNGVAPVLEPICWMGRNSYEIYLTHMILIIPLSPFLMAHPLLGAMVLLLGSATLGHLLASWYAEPLNRTIRPQPNGTMR